MGIAEQLSGAMGTSDLSWKEGTTKPVEYVAAMAGTKSLESDVFRAKGNDRAALHRAVLLLAQKAVRAGGRKRLFLSADQAQQMAKAALAEIIRPHCRHCTGAGVSIIDELKVVCPVCDGVAVHRYSDAERARLCKIPRNKWHLWLDRYLMVLAIARGSNDAESAAMRRMG